MGKIIVTQDQADRINYFRKDDESKGEAIRHHVNKWLSSVNTCLNELSVDQLARALYVGYEVEENDWVVRMDHEIEEPYKVIGRTDEGHIQIDDESASLLPSSVFRYATTQEIAAEKEHRMDSKLDRIWIGLSDYERNGFYRKLVRGGY